MRMDPGGYAKFKHPLRLSDWFAELMLWHVFLVFMLIPFSFFWTSVSVYRHLLGKVVNVAVVGLRLQF